MRSSSLTPSAPEHNVRSHNIGNGKYQLTVNPRVTNDDGALWKLELGDFFLNARVRQSSLLNGNNFLAITVGVNIDAKSDVTFDLTSGHIDHGLVEAVL